MTDAPDAQLLDQFARNQSEAAFAELVKRYIGLVYSVAFRKTGNPQHAKDITQAVFIILARKSGSLSANIVLPGWLYNTARLTAANFQRAEMRRIRREQEAFMQSTNTEPALDALWRELSPQLEDAMAGLGTGDRDAIVLRFFQNLSLANVGATLGVTERAAQKRVNRALEKLRKFFAKRGVVSTTAIIAGIISCNSVQAAPPALAQSVTTAAIAKGATACGSTLTLVKGVLKVMAWTKAKTAAALGIGILLAAGTTTVAVQAIQHHDDSQWDVGQLNGRILKAAPHIVRIVPSKFPDVGSWVSIGNGSIMGFGVSARDIIEAACQVADTRTIVLATLPPEKYDFIANLPSGSQPALLQELKKQFGIIGRPETIETNMLFLRLITANAPGLRPNTTRTNTSHYGAHSLRGQLEMNNGPIASVAGFLEMALSIPVVDQTGLSGYYDANMKWNWDNDPQHENLKVALKDQLGLELVPTNMPIDMLVVENVR